MNIKPKEYDTGDNLVKSDYKTNVDLTILLYILTVILMSYLRIFLIRKKKMRFLN